MTFRRTSAKTIYIIQSTFWNFQFSTAPNRVDWKVSNFFFFFSVTADVVWFRFVDSLMAKMKPTSTYQTFNYRKCCFFLISFSLNCFQFFGWKRFIFTMWHGVRSLTCSHSSSAMTAKSFFWMLSVMCQTVLICCKIKLENFIFDTFWAKSISHFTFYRVFSFIEIQSNHLSDACAVRTFTCWVTETCERFRETLKIAVFRLAKRREICSFAKIELNQAKQSFYNIFVLFDDKLLL